MIGYSEKRIFLHPFTKDWQLSVIYNFNQNFNLFDITDNDKFTTEMRGVSPEQQQDKSPQGVQTLVVGADDSAETG